MHRCEEVNIEDKRTITHKPGFCSGALGMDTYLHQRTSPSADRVRYTQGKHTRVDQCGTATIKMNIAILKRDASNSSI